MTETDPQADRVTALLAALEKLPAHRGLTYRGYEARLGRVRSRTLVSGVLVASSRDPRVATSGFTTAGVWAVISVHGRDLSAVSRQPQEAEVVFRPGTLFLPLETFDVDGLEVTMVEELDPDVDRSKPPEHTLAELVGRATDDLQAARAGDPVSDVTPGKFVGPLT